MTDVPWLPPEPDGSPGIGWREHTPGHPMPCEADALVDVLERHDRERQTVLNWLTLSAARVCWGQSLLEQRSEVVAWRYACPAARRLVAENEALRAALQTAVDAYGQPGGPWNVPSDPGGWLERARNALAAGGEGGA